MYELYDQLLPTKLYTSVKTETCTEGKVMCRVGGKAPESVSHILAGCAALVQTKYLIVQE